MTHIYERGVAPSDTFLSKTTRKYILHFQFYDAVFIAILKNDDKYTYVDFAGVKKEMITGGRSPTPLKDSPHFRHPRDTSVATDASGISCLARVQYLLR